MGGLFGGGPKGMLSPPLSNYWGLPSPSPAPPPPLFLRLFYCIWFPPSQSAIFCTLSRLLCVIQSRQEARFSGRLSWKELVQLYIICFRQTWCSYIYILCFRQNWCNYIYYASDRPGAAIYILCFRQNWCNYIYYASDRPGAAIYILCFR